MQNVTEGALMDGNAGSQPMVVRTERGLVIGGTRKTLYQVMDYVTAGWPPTLIRNWMDLTDEQITAVMEYITQHRAEVEAEYREVLSAAEASRRYWEERNRERFAAIAAMPRDPKYAAIHAKIDAARARRGGS